MNALRTDRDDDGDDDVISARSADSSAHQIPRSRRPGYSDVTVGTVNRVQEFSPSVRAAQHGLDEDKPRDCGADGCWGRDCTKLPSTSPLLPLRSDKRQNPCNRNSNILYGILVILTGIQTPDLADRRSLCITYHQRPFRTFLVSVYH